jgi:hypothetical protein
VFGFPLIPLPIAICMGKGVYREKAQETIWQDEEGTRGITPVLQKPDKGFNFSCAPE